MRVSSLITPIALLGLSVVTGELLAQARDARPSAVDSLLSTPPVPAEVVQRMALGFKSIAADIEYLQAIQVFGDPHYSRGSLAKKTRKSLAVYRLLDYTTDLDPQFSYAYIFGANSIPIMTVEDIPINLDSTIALLRKGTERAGENCDEAIERQINCDWRIPFYLAYFLASFDGNLAEAARAEAEAARRPKRPAYIPALATRLAAAGGAIDTGIALAKDMLKNAETEDKRQEFEERIRLLYMEKDLRTLEDAADRYEKKNRRTPKTLQDLVTAGFISAIPAEPHGGAYVLEPATGEIRSTAANRLRLPDTVARQIRLNKAHEEALRREALQ